ncbi:MAG: hypothetical protein ACJAVJ_002094, partial [Planctomycetota bacterium]
MLTSTWITARSYARTGLALASLVALGAVGASGTSQQGP